MFCLDSKQWPPPKPLAVPSHFDYSASLRPLGYLRTHPCFLTGLAMSPHMHLAILAISPSILICPWHPCHFMPNKHFTLIWHERFFPTWTPLREWWCLSSAISAFSNGHHSSQCFDLHFTSSIDVFGALGGVNPRPRSVRDLQTFHESRWILPLMSVQLVIFSNEIVTNFILCDPSWHRLELDSLAQSRFRSLFLETLFRWSRVLGPMEFGHLWRPWPPLRATISPSMALAFDVHLADWWT